MRSITELQELFNHSLKSEISYGYPKELYHPIAYVLGLGGKHMRPVMLLHACEMFGRDAVTAIPQAIAIELFHNFTLVHDDIMDQAPIRRGLPAVHEKYGNTAAILSGDAMFVMAYKFLSRTSAELLPELIDLFSECAVQVCEGQQLDMNFEAVPLLQEGEYMQMIGLKTASLIATSLKIGAMAGGASPEDAMLIFDCGKKLGISFQLKDDWLDCFGSADKVGKQKGGDILRNKKTILLIEALQREEQDTRTELLHWYSSTNFENREKIESVINIFNRLHISESVQQKMQHHFDEAMKSLDKVSIAETQKTNLRLLARLLLFRDS